eukprot:GFUD01020384.1.p1 GENE.GFUD01020384.1~~GFUD01020384.1.p1  ORF type:complete len:309 (+),score=71.44 GFUD01020384.1:39-965(+)
MDKKFNISSNNFGERIQESFRDLRNDQELFDVTLACGGNKIQAHKIILSACSGFFKEVFKLHKNPNPLVYIKGASIENLSALISFMYLGQVEVAKDDLNEFLSLGEELKVVGLQLPSDQNKNDTQKSVTTIADVPNYEEPQFSESPHISENKPTLENMDALSFIKVEACSAAMEDNIDCDPFAYRDFQANKLHEFDHNINIVESPAGKRKGFPRNPRIKTSPIWDFYQEDPLDPRKAICQVPTCSKVMSRGKGERKTWTTASLKAHLKVHKVEWGQYRIKCVEQTRKKEEEEIANNFCFPGYPQSSQP